MHREEDREGRSAAAGGSGGGTQDQWTEEDFAGGLWSRLRALQEGGAVSDSPPYAEIDTPQ
jgi:hypothetical protein